MKQILLVEDDKIMRITVHDRLLREKWLVDTAVNGRMAMTLLEQKQYHLILSDIRMPGMNGLELLDRARRHSPLIDVFMMTAYGSVEDAIACLRHGAADYILKPFEMETSLSASTASSRSRPSGPAAPPWSTVVGRNTRK